MRIGIEGSCLANRRGFGRYAREIVAALARQNTEHEIVLVVDRPSLDEVTIPSGVEPLVVDLSIAPTRAASAQGARSPLDLFRMSRALSHARFDVLYFPTSYTFVPVRGIPRVVVTIFDLLPRLLPGLVFPNRLGRLFWNLKERAAVASAHAIVTTSEASRRDLEAFYRLPPGRVLTIHAAPDSIFRPRPHDSDSDAALRRHGLDPARPFWLYVGGLSPHKNLPRLLEAFAQLGGESSLAIVGDFGDVFHTHVPALRAQVQSLGIESRVVWTGYMPDDDLVHAYNRALALVQPSLMEGFGLTPVEAMACGTPVACSTAGSLPEVVADAGLSFDPRDIAAITESLRRLESDHALHAELSRRARARAFSFSWDHAACEVLNVLIPQREAAPSPSRRAAIAAHSSAQPER